MDSQANSLKMRRPGRKRKPKPKKKPWADIPEEIFTRIYHQLDLKNKFQFSSVCKSWNTLHTHLNTHPFLLNCGSPHILCDFIFPSPDESSLFLENRRLLSKFDYQFCKANVIAVKRGWLLMNDRNSQSDFILYNPFLLEVNRLPCLDAGPNPKAVISAPPTRSDSVIFVVRCKENHVIISLLYSYDQTAWKDYSFNIDNNQIASCDDVIYTEGKAYCVFNNGVVGCFSLENQDWAIETSPSTTFEGEIHMAECEGEIYSVGVGVNELRFEFFKMDRKKLEWKKVKNLGNRAMFLNYESSSILMSTIESELKNKLFYFGKEDETSLDVIWCFSLESASHSEFLSLDTMYFRHSNQTWIEPPY